MLVQIRHVSPVSPLRFSPAGHQHFPLCDSTELRFAQNLCGGDMNRAATNQWEEKESAVWPSHQRCAAPTEEATSCESSSPPTESRSEPPPKASRICGVPLASAVFVRPRNHFRPSGLFLVFSQLWSDFSPHSVDFSPCRGLSRAKCFRCQMP